MAAAEPTSPGSARARHRLAWHVAWAVVALAYAAPVVNIAYDRLIHVTQQARERLIVEYRLWELHPEYHGTPQNWTRFAARLLSDNQLLRRVHLMHRDLASEIELDYRRDLTVAQSEVVLLALAAWAVPIGALYGMGYLIMRRRRPAPELPKQPAKPGYSEAKYRP